MNNLPVSLLDSINETLAAAIVTIAVSMLLYNLTRNLRDRVARASGAVLACVTIAYIADVFLSLEPGPNVTDAVQRLQWTGIAFIPAAIFHLSDALLETTGLPSRGRRRTVVRILYLVGAVFLLLAALTNWLVYPIPARDGLTSLRAAPLFVVYLAYFLIATISGFINVNRARQRCQTRSTRRRMAYLEFAMITPVLGIFPFSTLFVPGGENSSAAIILVIAANIVVILMLSFLAFPLSFFGSRIPDRVVKADLLRFFLRGPATGLLILVVIISTRQATQILSLPGDAFMPFAVVALVLFWQWMVDLALPWLDKWLIYFDEDSDQVEKIQTLSRYLFTRRDLTRLLENILEAGCDYLHVDHAFIVSVYNGDQEIIHTTGDGEVNSDLLRQEREALMQLFEDKSLAARRWRSYWLFGLYSRRISDNEGNLTLIGTAGFEAHDDADPMSSDTDEVLGKLIRRAAQTLDDLLLQAELYAALEGLLPQIAGTRDRATEVEYKPGRTPLPALSAGLPNRDVVIEQVQAALRHYYGGPGMSQSRLLELNIVRDALPENDHNPVKALRAVLDKAIANQRPAGEPDLKSQEWLLYNILELRFIKKRKVREIANRLYMSDANLYRKQNLAIEAVADAIIKLEQEALALNPQSGD